VRLSKDLRDIDAPAAPRSAHRRRAPEQGGHHGAVRPRAVPPGPGCPARPRGPAAAADLVPGRGRCADGGAAHAPGPGDVAAMVLGGLRRCEVHRLGTLRMFFIRLDKWGWDEAPPKVPMFTGDLPRQDHPLPKALDDGAAARLLRAAQTTRACWSASPWRCCCAPGCGSASRSRPSASASCGRGTSAAQYRSCGRVPRTSRVIRGGPGRRGSSGVSGDGFRSGRQDEAPPSWPTGPLSSWGSGGYEARGSAAAFLGSGSTTASAPGPLPQGQRSALLWSAEGSTAVRRRLAP
jgi:hypothetical protein